MKRAKLIAARYSKGWTQEEAAERIGVIRGTISQWERGIVAPHPFYVHQLCTVFDQTASELGLEKLVRETPVHQEMQNGSGEPNAIAEDKRSSATVTTMEQCVREAQERNTQLPGLQNVDTQRRYLLQIGVGAVGKLLTSVSDELTSTHTGVNPFSFQQEQSTSFDEKTIAKFEKITADCWLLLRLDGLPTVEQLLPTYLPRFALFAQRSSQYQERIASITTQGYILQGLVAVLNSNLTDSERFCENAVFYARIANDRNLEVAALKHLATKFLDNGYPLHALQTYQEVLPFIKKISPLLQGRTYLGLSLAYARTNQEKQAFYYLDQAYDSFPDNPESDVSSSYADCHTSSLNHYEGLIQAEFGRFEKARTLFAQVEELPTRHTIPERTRIEIINCQAEASLALGDVGASRDLIEKSLAGALHLKSDKRYNDALMLYKHARLLFPQEGLIKNLAALFIR